MSQPTLASDQLLVLLDQYAEDFDKGNALDSLLSRIVEVLPRVSDPDVFRSIAARMWDRYFCIDVDTMIQVLRRWLEIEPQSKEAKRALGSYLLGHGPDWDEEGNRLLQEGNS